MEAVVLTGMLVFVRMVTVITGLPLFGALGMPRQASIMASVAVAFLLTPTLPPVSLPANVGQLLLSVLLEVGFGTLLVLGVRLAFSAVTLAGELMGMQMGLALATLFDPLQRVSSSPPRHARHVGCRA